MCVLSTKTKISSVNSGVFSFLIVLLQLVFSVRWISLRNKCIHILFNFKLNSTTKTIRKKHFAESLVFAVPKCVHSVYNFVNHYSRSLKIQNTKYIIFIFIWWLLLLWLLPVILVVLIIVYLIFFVTPALYPFSRSPTHMG